MNLKFLMAKLKKKQGEYDLDKKAANVSALSSGKLKKI